MVALLFLLTLFAAGLVLVGESRLGRRWGGGAFGRARIGLYFAASAAGTALLVAATGREWLLFLALAPLTVLSMARMTTLLLRRGAGMRTGVTVAVLLVLAIWGCLLATPQPLSRQSLMEEILYQGNASPVPDSIDPAAFRPVQV